MRGLQKMIEKEDYCIDILTQSLAVQKSLGSLNKLILENHLKTCAPKKLNSSAETEREHAIQEMLELYELSNIKGK